MATLIYIRHGQSVFNSSGRFTGQLDVSLDETGVDQASLAAEYILAHFKVDGIFSSDLQRAYNTAKPISDALGIEICTMKSLRELDVGSWTGEYIEDVKTKYTQAFRSYMASPGTFVFKGGESYSDFADRAVNSALEIAEETKDGLAVVATHGGLIRALVSRIRNIPYEQISSIKITPNASITIIEINGKDMSIIAEGFCEYLRKYQKHSVAL